MKIRNKIRWMTLPAMLAALLALSCSEDRLPASYQTHPTGWNEPASAAFHGTDAKCGTCHRPDYATSDATTGCRSCHPVMTAGAVCTACHGLPPVDDATLPRGFDSGAAGAHAAHARYACRECHWDVTTYNFVHVNEPPAEVVFDRSQIAQHAPFDRPTYSHTGNPTSGNGTCANNYCHSNGRGGPPLRTAAWVGGSLACGDCHFIPPPGPIHPQNPRCHECHGNVDPASDYTTPAGIRFLSARAHWHVNGQVNR